jgi:undecaprenyl-diphosphatase
MTTPTAAIATAPVPGRALPRTRPGPRRHPGGPAARRDHVHADPPATPASVLRTRPRLLVALGALFAALAASAALWGGRVLLTWDEPIQRWVEAHRTPTLDTVFLTFSRCGSTVTVLLLGSLAAAVTWRRCRAVGTALLVATFSRPLLEFALKAIIDRQRPDLHRLVVGTGPSFPSGHVMAAVALWGLLPLVVSLYTRRRGLWWASAVVSAVMIAGIAASRVYLGVHWFSDVTAGLVVGAFFLLGVEAVLVRQHARYPCGLLTPCDDQAPSSSSAVTGRWSDSSANTGNPGSPNLGTEMAATSTSGDT